MILEQNRGRLLVAAFVSMVSLFGFLGATRAAQAPPEADERIVMDCAKRLVKVPVSITRIGCLYTFSGHCVAMLGKGDDIVSISNGLKRNDLFNRICPSVLTARIPKAQGAVNIEEVLSARPQIIFIPADMARSHGFIAHLKRFKIPYLVVDYDDIRGQLRAVAMIGEVLLRQGRAARFVQYAQGCIKRVQNRVSKLPRQDRLRLYHAVNGPLRATVVNGITTDWLRTAGAVNVATSDNPHVFASKSSIALEQILIWNPDAILANEPSTVTTIRQSRKWAHLKAVKAGRVYQMPIGISRWGHPGGIETALAILWTAQKLYPRLFTDFDLTAETRFFYKTFLDYELSADEVELILSGKTRRSPKNMRQKKTPNTPKGH